MLRLAILLAWIALAGCQARPVYVDAIAPMRELSVPFGDYNLLAWVEADTLVVQYEPDALEREWSNELWELQIETGQLERLPLEDSHHADCQVTFFTSPTAIPDGRLAFEYDCTKLGLDSSDTYLMYWDVASGSSGRMYEYEIPVVNGTYAFSPSLFRAVVSSHTAIEDRLYWLDAEGPSEIELPLARANKPAWSPDGISIAFWGNEELRGLPGPDWADQPYDLWIMPADCDQDATGCSSAATRVLRGIHSPNVLQWSPDGRWLLFDGTARDAIQGIWLFDVASAQLWRVASGDYVRPAWSPDGKQIAVIGPLENTDTVGYRTTVFVLDISELALGGSVPTP